MPKKWWGSPLRRGKYHQFSWSSQTENFAPVLNVKWLFKAILSSVTRILHHFHIKRTRSGSSRLRPSNTLEYVKVNEVRPWNGIDLATTTTGVLHSRNWVISFVLVLFTYINHVFRTPNYRYLDFSFNLFFLIFNYYGYIIIVYIYGVRVML